MEETNIGGNDSGTVNWIVIKSLNTWLIAVIWMESIDQVDVVKERLTGIRRQESFKMPSSKSWLRCPLPFHFLQIRG